MWERNNQFDISHYQNESQEFLFKGITASTGITLIHPGLKKSFSSYGEHDR